MASDRVVIVRVLGIATIASSNAPAAFTTRAGLSYLGMIEVPGVVVDVGTQLSSEIAIFGTLGSDPTTTFTLLATPETSQLTLSRGKRPLLDANGANVTVTDYIKPFGASNTGFLIVTDTANASANMMLRIGTTTFEVMSLFSPTVLEVRRRWGSADVPIPLSVTGFGIFGATVYDVTPGNPTGGIESLPVVISTAPLSATSRSQEQIIFRGIVNRVTTDMSAGARNQIKVDCGSLMAFVKSAKFTPAQGGTRAVPKNAEYALAALANGATSVEYFWQIVHDKRLYGEPFETTGAVGDVRVPLMQIRKDTYGGTVALDEFLPWTYQLIDDFNTLIAQVSARYKFDVDQAPYMIGNSFLSTFRDGWFNATGFGPALEPSTSVVAIYEDNGRNVPQITGYTYQFGESWFDPLTLGETTFIAASFADLICDLLLGTVNGTLQNNFDFTNGCRAATESAWLPFGVQAGVQGVQDIIDIPSLLVATAPFAGTSRREIPSTPMGISQTAFNLSSGVMLPYVHAEAKTVGDVLEQILKRCGIFMVYDNSKFRFGRWAARPSAPVVVNDSGLAEPKASLTFDRNNCVQTALMKICWSASGESAVTQSVPVNNVDLGIGSLGKVVDLSHWEVLSSIEFLPDSDMFANAVQLVTRFSQAAAMVEVIYRDDVYDLIVGQQIAFSSDYVPNADGGMGVTLASGFVMKAARSWRTPTTAYTIALPGYLSPINRIAVFSCSGTVVSVIGDDVVIAPNNFTLPVGQASEGAPTSDAAAFEQSLQLQGGPLNLVLRDQYGTYLGVAAPLAPGDVAGNTLIGIPAISAWAVPGDVIVLSRATGQSSVATLWDVFQSNNVGQVNASTTLAYKWVL